MKIGLIILFGLFFLISIILLLNIRPIDIIESVNQKRKDYANRRRSIKDIVEGAKPQKKKFFVVEEMYSALEIMNDTNQKDGKTRLIAGCVIFAVIGVIIAVFMLKNIFAIPLLAFVGFMIPIWKQKLYRNSYEKFIDTQLEGTVSIITTEYIKNGDIINAFKNNLSAIDISIRYAFEEFVAQTAINPNIEQCIRSLQKKFQNAIFYEWCNMLIKTYQNSEVKENLISVTKKFSTVRIIQSDLDVETSSELSSYIVIMLFTILVYPLVYLVNKDWFMVYINTFAGNMAVAFTIFTIIFAVSKIISLLRPVKFER